MQNNRIERNSGEAAAAGVLIRAVYPSRCEDWGRTLFSVAEAATDG